MLTPLLLAAALQAATAAEPAPVTPRAAYLDCLSMAGSDPDKAARLARRWTDEENGGSAALHCLGVAQAAQGEEATASQTLEQAAVLAQSAGLSEAPELYGMAAESAARAADITRAEELLGRAYTARPQPEAEAELRKLSARLSMAQGDVDDARADLLTATQRSPDDVEAWVLLAAAERRAGNLSGAESAIREAASRAPDDPAVMAEANRVIDAMPAAARAEDVTPD